MYFAENMDLFNESEVYEDHNFSYIFDEDTTHNETESYVFYVDGILLLLVALFGIGGTLMSIVVLLKPRIRDFFSGKTVDLLKSEFI